MTDAQLKSRELDIKADELQEKKRSNKMNERIRRGEGHSKALTAGTGALKSIGGAIAAFNDVKWYSLNEQLMRDVANISYHNPLGKGDFLYYSSATQTPGVTSVNTSTVPGILRLNYVMSCGIDGEDSSSNSVNIAAQNIYSFVRNVNSGARNYQAPDLMMYFLTVINAYVYVATLARIYSVAKTYKTENYYFNSAALQALGVPSASVAYWRNNLAQLRATINNALQRLRTFAVPKSMPLLERWLWLATNMFKDSEVKKSQLYIFVPEFIYVLDWNNAAMEGIKPDYTSLDSVAATLKRIFDGIFGNNDIGVMSGDVLKAYGETGLIELGSISEDFHIETKFSEEVLSQIGSARYVGTLGYLATSGDYVKYTPVIVQDETTGVISHKMTATAGDYTHLEAVGNSVQKPINANANSVATPISALRESNGSWIINMYKDVVTPGDNMVATRLAPVFKRQHVFDSPGVERIQGYVVSCGSEFITTGDMYFITSVAGVDSGVTVLQSINLYNSGVFVANSTSSTTTSMTLKDPRIMIYYNEFDWAPRAMVVALFATYSGNTPSLWENVIYDSLELQNFARVDAQALSNMHSVALASEYAIPLLGPKPFRSR